MEPEDILSMRADVAAMRGDLMLVRQNTGVLEARADALENWRERYLSQEEQVVAKLFNKVDELVANLSAMRADFARLGGERDTEGRITIAIVGLLSALGGGLATNLFHGH